MRRALALSLVILMAIVLAPQGASAAKFRFTHGVAAGDVTKRSALLWTRTNQKARVVAQVSKTRRFRTIARTAAARAKPRNDFTVEVNVTRLKPGTRYFYRFVGPGGKRSQVGKFRTAPPGSNVKFVFSGDSDTTKGTGNFRSNVAAVLDSARREKAHFFVWGGDTIYADSSVAGPPASTLKQYRKTYKEQRSLAAVKTMLASTSVVALWDDHEVVNDYAGDLSSPSPTPFSGNPLVQPLTVGQVNRGQRAFREYFPVRETGGEHYRRLKWGEDLDVFVLDTRTYRTSPLSAIAACDQDGVPGPPFDPDVAPTLPQTYRDGFAALFPYLASPPPAGCLDAINDTSRTMLGDAQKQWLKSRLQASTATFKVIVTSVPIQHLYALPYDRWDGYTAERTEILDFIGANDVEGVVWVATDTHATLVNDVCNATALPFCDDTGMDEIVTGPMGTDTFATQIDDFAGPGASALVSAFFGAPQPSGLQMECVNLNQDSYGRAVLNSTAGTLTLNSRAPVAAAPGADLCTALVIPAPGP